MTELLQDFDIYTRFAIALALGLIIGIERGWHQRQSEEGERIAGIRTFGLISLLGAFWGLFADIIGDVILGFALIGFVGLIIAGYILSVREHEDYGMTTEIAAFITFSLGVAVVKGYVVLSIATGVIMVLILSLKPRLHQWIQSLEPKEIYAGINFLLISAVVLPFLPNSGYGPWNTLNPFELWMMVVLIAGLSFFGYILLQKFGGDLGVLFTSLTGGLVSSTAVTVTMGGFAKKVQAVHIFVIGVILASSTVFIRVVIWISIFNKALIAYVWVPVVLMMLVSLIGVGWIWYNRDTTFSEKAPLNVTSPLQFSTALKFGFVLAAIMLLAEASRQWFGDAGIYALSVISGLADIDSITLSLAEMSTGSLAPEVAANGIIFAALTNTLVKGLIFAYIAGIGKGKSLLTVFLATIAAGLAGLLMF